MCKISASWDTPLNDGLMSQWQDWKSSIQNLADVAIKRCYRPSGFGNIIAAEIHVFCDASTIGYGAVSYLRLVNSDRQVHCSLLMSKARVAPLKPTTIPRLELQAAVLASQISQIIKNRVRYSTERVLLDRFPGCPGLPQKHDKKVSCLCDK